VALWALPWWLRIALGLAGLGFWWALLRWTPAGRWQALLGAAVAASFLGGAFTYGLAGLDVGARAGVEATTAATGVPAAGPAIDGGAGEAVVIGVTLLPLVIAAVAGWIGRGRRSPHRAAYTYVAPALVGLGVLVLAPFAFGIGLAFTRVDHGHFAWVGLHNFARILSSEGYGITQPLSFYFTLAVTVLWTALNVALHAGIGLAMALVLNRPGLPFKGVYRMLLIVPWAVPNYITALIWKGMFNKQYGLINHLLGTAGVEPVGWFSHFWTAFLANVTTNTWLGFPFMMVVCLGALQSIPQDLYEAASVDGASRWHQFRHITLPLLKPALLPAIILGSVWTFNMFNVVYLVSGGQPNNSTDILITEAYRWAFEQGQYGYAAAYSVLIFLILLSYSLLTQRVAKAAEGAYA
jgi:arabinogalactan oligomer/maltooligosaccharide transport system permease protein